MDRPYQLESLRRSLAMLSPGVAGLKREDALRLIEELQVAEDRLERLKAELRRLAEEG